MLGCAVTACDLVITSYKEMVSVNCYKSMCAARHESCLLMHTELLMLRIQYNFQIFLTYAGR